MKNLYYYDNFETNESMKNWLSAFLIMSNLGIVPLSVKTADAETKKEFIENQPIDKIEAAKFFKFLTNYGFQRPVDDVWEDFIKTDSSIKSSLEDVEKYINKDGKTYHFDKKYQSNDFENVDIHKFNPVNWTTDMGNFYPDELEPNLNNWISDYEKKTSIEIALITVKSLGDLPIENYGDELFERIGIGKKGADNGILIIFSMEDRKSRIQTGYGMEPFLTDLQCKRILENVVKPYFKEGKFYEGTMAALESIKSELGEEAFENKVQWLEERDAKNKLEMQASMDKFIDFLLSALALATLIAPFGYIFWRRHKNKKTREAISYTLNQIKTLQSRLPQKTEVNSKVLIDRLRKAQEISNKVIDKPKKDAEYLKNLRDYTNLLDNSIREYESKKASIKKDISDINSWQSFSKNALLTLDKAVLAYNEVIKYGYNIPKPSTKEEVIKLDLLGIQSFELLSSNIDSAISNFDLYKKKLSSVLSSGQNAITQLSSIKSAEQNLRNMDAKISSAVSDMNRYKRWSRSSEISEIESNINRVKRSSSDILKKNSELLSLISFIGDMERKWRRRKEDEEEEERRKKRAEEDRRRRMSSSSSSSSSSFGGFGGGRSGGGGASSGW